MTVYALDNKLTGVCLTGLIAVEPRTYIAARCRTAVSTLCRVTIGRHLPKAQSRNQQTSVSLDQVSSGSMP